MKKITTYLVVRDTNGVAQTGVTINVYPAGTTNGAGITVTHQGGGLYKVIIEPSVNVQCISKFYDIYLSGIKQQEKQFFEDWVWFVTDKEVDAEQTFNFADLVDENGEALPSTIPNAYIELTHLNDRLGRITAQTSTSFTVTLASSGNDEKGKFNFKIIVKK